MDKIATFRVCDGGHDPKGSDQEKAADKVAMSLNL